MSEDGDRVYGLAFKRWAQALKIWNKTQPTWCIPVKGTKEYAEVKAIADDITRYGKPVGYTMKMKNKKRSAAEAERNYRDESKDRIPTIEEDEDIEDVEEEEEERPLRATKPRDTKEKGPANVSVLVALAKAYNATEGNDPAKVEQFKQVAKSLGVPDGKALEKASTRTGVRGLIAKHTAYDLTKPNKLSSKGNILEHPALPSGWDA